MQDPRIGQELGIGPKVRRMFPVDDLRLPLVAPISVAVATTISFIPSLHFGMPDLVTHLPLRYNTWF